MSPEPQRNKQDLSFFPQPLWDEYRTEKYRQMQLAHEKLVSGVKRKVARWRDAHGQFFSPICLPRKALDFKSWDRNDSRSPIIFDKNNTFSKRENSVWGPKEIFRLQSRKNKFRPVEAEDINLPSIRWLSL